MHVIFAVSALVMLVGTIWMLAKDHNREWRQWQLDDRARERWTVEAQFKQAEADTSAERDRLQDQLVAAQTSPVDLQLVDQFRELVKAQDAQLKEQAVSHEPADFTALDRAVEEFKNQSDAAEKDVHALAAARANLID
jgi:hypothetical protein